MLDKTDEVKKISGAVDNLLKIINNQQSQIKELEDKLQEKDGHDWDNYGFRVVKAILRYIAQGIEEQEAIRLAYDDFAGKISMRTILCIWQHSHASKAGLILYGRAYCAKKMRLAGYKTYEIAQTLRLSVTTVQKLLKQCCVSD